MISLQNVTKRFGTKTALSNISMDIPDNQIIGIVGPKGRLLFDFISDWNQLVIHGLNNRTLPKHELVIEVHQQVPYVPLNLRGKMYVVNK